MTSKVDIESTSLYIELMGTDTQTSNQVRQIRRLNDLTQAELAKAVEVSRQTIVSIEGGDYAPSVYLALRLAQVLDTTCLLYTSPSPRDATLSRMPSSA